MTAQTYIARADGWIAGRRVLQGDEISLTPSAARYEPVDPAPQGKAGKAPRRVGRAAAPLATEPAQEVVAEPEAEA